VVNLKKQSCSKKICKQTFQSDSLSGSKLKTINIEQYLTNNKCIGGEWEAWFKPFWSIFEFEEKATSFTLVDTATLFNTANKTGLVWFY
jgi:hypothetical protein